MFLIIIIKNIKGVEGMRIFIINSGSNGNCSVLADSNGNQILLDCGLPYDKIMQYIDFDKLNFVLLTHIHQDHSKSLKTFQKFCVDCYIPQTIFDGKLIDTSFWKIMPIKLVHNVECYGFLIYSKVDRKKIAYITDTNYIPKLAEIDCLIIDTNYDQEIVDKKLADGMPINLGYRNHLSTQNVKQYLEELPFKVRYLVAFHISNSNLNNIDKIKQELGPFVENLIISAPNTKVEVL